MSDIKNDPSPRPAPEGWTIQSHANTFSGRAGPFYFRKEDERAGVGFFAEPHHANMGGVIHGGALLTLADVALWDICRREIGVFKGVTVTLNSEFVGAGPIGGFIEATGEMVKSGRKLMFARGLITADGAPLMSFSGTLKRVS
ncbi:PaaI family thioesterase [Hyphococcus sp.]|uniref:PaaI family thioesterase n=1 Tax=Hyphococcus sp. TaxID=2038636 RepID=UPI00208080E7|nr:MAG: thioesterase [Marinicaulis sp.]